VWHARDETARQTWAQEATGILYEDEDIGSGPTEARCKIIGARRKGSGMRWVDDSAATGAVLRALYVSDAKVWDGFWAQPHRPAA
jgi:hypothetical protein